MKKIACSLMIIFLLGFSGQSMAICWVKNNSSSDETTPNALRAYLYQIDLNEAATNDCEILPPTDYDFVYSGTYEFNVAFFPRDLCDSYRAHGIYHPCWDADAGRAGIQNPVDGVKGIPVDTSKKLAKITLSNQLRIANQVQTLLGYYDEHDGYALPWLDARSLVVKADDGRVTPLINCEGRTDKWVGLMNVVVGVGDGVSRTEALGTCAVEEADVYICAGTVLKNPQMIGLNGSTAYLSQNIGLWCTVPVTTPVDPLDTDNDGDGVTENEGDCNDADASINPSQVENCDGVDENCDDVIDNGFDVDADGVTICGPDGDLDTTLDNDCDDTNSEVNPGKTEICSTTATTTEEDVDDNCDGEKLGKCAPEVVPDPDPSTEPDEEICTDGIDNNADTKIDCDDDGCKDKPVCAPENIDNDGDGLSENAGDCDDTDILITVCNGGLNVDDDGDGFTEEGGDCDDTDSDVSPGADEICDANPDAVIDDDDCDRQDDDDADADVPLCFDPNSEIIKPAGSGGSSGCGCDMGASENGSGATAVVALLAFGMMIWIRRGMRQA